MTFPHAEWRLLETKFGRGPWNMAVDEAILEAVIAGDAPPTLRLYGWEPPCLSIGYAQPLADVDRARLDDHHWDLVRRPTGGRAILHTDELTYAVIGPTEEPRLAGGVLESYRRLASALHEAICRIGVDAETNTPGPSNQASQADPVCFDIPSHYELTWDGKKIIGSAQSRRKTGLLQHGSLPLYGDLTRITQVLRYPNPSARAAAARRISERATTIETALGSKVSWELAAKTFLAAFQARLNLSLIRGDLSVVEQTRARKLLETKYTHPDWTERVP